jgi:hypothetical protein
MATAPWMFQFEMCCSEFGVTTETFFRSLHEMNG